MCETKRGDEEEIEGEEEMKPGAKGAATTPAATRRRVKRWIRSKKSSVCKSVRTVKQLRLLLEASDCADTQTSMCVLPSGS